jgi:hypothetical protein
MDSLTLDTRSFALQLAQVVETRTPHTATLRHFDLLDSARMQRENALNADPVGNLAYSERCQGRAATTIDHNALEDLDALFLAFFDEGMHPDTVAGTEIWQVVPSERILNFSNQGMGAHGFALQ